MNIYEATASRSREDVGRLNTELFNKRQHNYELTTRNHSLQVAISSKDNVINELTARNDSLQVVVSNKDRAITNLMSDLNMYTNEMPSHVNDFFKVKKELKATDHKKLI